MPIISARAKFSYNQANQFTQFSVTVTIKCKASYCFSTHVLRIQQNIFIFLLAFVAKWLIRILLKQPDSALLPLCTKIPLLRFVNFNPRVDTSFLQTNQPNGELRRGGSNGQMHLAGVEAGVEAGGVDSPHTRQKQCKVLVFLGIKVIFSWPFQYLMSVIVNISRVCQATAQFIKKI